MDSDTTLLLAALAAVPLGLAWVEYHIRRDKRLAEIARCDHVPGTPYPAAGSSNMFKRNCARCRAQQHCHEDGRPWELNDRWH